MIKNPEHDTICSDMFKKITIQEASATYGISRTALYHLGVQGVLNVSKEIRNGRAVNLYDKQELEKIKSVREAQHKKNTTK